MPDIKKILAAAKPRERTVQVCIAGDLAGRLDELTAKLAEVSEDWESASMAGSPGKKIAREMQEVREQLKAAQVPFLLRYIGDEEYSALLAAHPSENENELFDSESFPRALIAASCVDPAMSEEEAKQLFQRINQGEIKKLFDAAWEVHNTAGLVPFSLAASALVAALGDEK